MMARKTILMKETIRRKTEHFMVLMRSFIDECIDRAIMVHENNNRHAQCTMIGETLPDSNLLLDLEKKLKDYLIDIIGI